jgi:hypothetical protein
MSYLEETEVFPNDPRCGCVRHISEEGEITLTQCYTCLTLERLTRETAVMSHELSGMTSTLVRLVSTLQSLSARVEALESEKNKTDSTE